MATSPGVLEIGRRKGSDRINERPSKNLHHGIRLAENLGFKLNLFVTINFSHTSLPEVQTDLAFKKVRDSFGKWARRPRRDARMHAVPPTFVWVIENPEGKGTLHVHWAVHVPEARHTEFNEKLEKWVAEAAGELYSDKVIDVRPTKSGPLGLERYMLKGLHAPLCRKFGIRHSNQGFVTGKRIGHSKNIGPVQLAQWVDRGVHNRPIHWRPNKYNRKP